MIPKTQEFIFDMMLEPTLKALKESGDEGVPLLLCPEEYLPDFVEYLRQEKVKQIFDRSGYFPIIQTVESHHAEELSKTKAAFTQMLVFLSLLIESDASLSQSYLMSMKFECRKVIDRCSNKDLWAFIDKHLGFFLSKDKAGLN